jgi:hypothetical protein
LKVQILAPKDDELIHQNEERIEALDVDSFPPWLEQRVASMCEIPDIDSVADVAKQMRKGIPQVKSLLAGEAGSVMNKAQQVRSESGNLAAQIEQAVWQSVEVLWGVNTAVKTTRTSIQTQLF